MKKYELTSDKKVVNGVELHRVKALVDFGKVKAGELGGWIKSEDNLSQDENARAYKDSEKSGREYERVVKYVESILKEENNNKNGFCKEVCI